MLYRLLVIFASKMKRFPAKRRGDESFLHTDMKSVGRRSDDLSVNFDLGKVVPEKSIKSFKPIFQRKICTSRMN